MEKLIHSLNFYGILIESLTIILSWKKIFTQITIATIFPLSLLSLCHAQISELLFPNILHNEEGSFKNSNITWDTIWFWLFKIVYVVFFLVLSLVSTSTVVYAVARVFTTKEVCFGEVMSVVPKVWKRLMVTFAWSLMIVVVYNMAAFSLLFPWLGSGSGSGSMDGHATARIAISGPILIIYMMGFVYTSIIWHLASVVSVLEEDCCGVEAMVKSKVLVKGKMVISLAVFLLLNLSFILIQVVFERFVVLGELSIWSRIGWGIVCFLLLSGFTLLGLVTQTIVYFICKLYHYQMIDNSYVTNHHKVYLGDYAPLRSNEVQQLDQC